MKKSTSWADIIQCYIDNIEGLFSGWVMFNFFHVIGFLCALAIVYIVSSLLGLSADRILFKDGITPAEGDAMLSYGLLIPYMAWLWYGWTLFMLHLVRSGCDDYHLISSVPLKRLWPAIGLTILYMPLSVLGKFVFRLPHVWQIVFVYALCTVAFSRLLFAWYYLVDGSSVADAIVRGNRRANQYPLLMLLVAAIKVFIGPKLLLSRKDSITGSDFISSLINVSIILVIICLSLFVDYLIARLYAETECKTSKDCSEAL